MDEERIARLSILSAIALVIVGLLLAITFTILLATMPSVSNRDGTDFSAIYDWQQRVQIYNAFQDLGNTMVLSAIAPAILGVWMHRGTRPAPATQPGAPTAPLPSTPAVATKGPHRP